MRRWLTTGLMLVIASAAFQPLAFAMNACCASQAMACHPQTASAKSAASSHDHAHMHHAQPVQAPLSTIQSRHVHDHGCPMNCCSTTASTAAVLITPALQIADTNQAVSVRIAEAQRQTYRITQELSERGPPALRN